MHVESVSGQKRAWSALRLTVRFAPESRHPAASRLMPALCQIARACQLGTLSHATVES